MADGRIRGEWLMTLRQQAGLGRTELARRVNVWDRATVGAWEHGVQQPSARKIPLLADALGVRPLDLFELDSPPSLATLRRAAGLTLMQLAARTDMSYARCQRLEKGLLIPSSAERARLAAALGVRRKDIQSAAHRVDHHTAATRKESASAGPNGK